MKYSHSFRGHPPPRIVILILFISLVVLMQVQAVDWNDPFELTDNTLTNFGSLAALDGTRLALAANQDFSTKAVYLYELNNGTWEAASPPLLPGGIGVFDFFPSDLTLDGDIVVASAMFKHVGQNNHQGVVFSYQFDGENWVELPILTANDGQADDNFGSSVALDGDILVVGADGVNDGEESIRGAAYVYQLNGVSWQLVTRLDPVHDDVRSYGTRVAISGEHIAVATANWVGALSNQGTVYLYRFNDNEVKFVQRFIGVDNDAFGAGIALQGNQLMIGASLADVKETANQGVVSIYTFNGKTWTAVDQLIAKDGKQSDFFGGTINLDGEILTVSATGVDTISSREGILYVFGRNGEKWVQTDKLFLADAEPNTLFGSSHGLSGDIIVVGVPSRDVGETANQGVVFTYLPLITAPTDLVATTRSPTQIDLVWNAPIGAETYTLERSPGGANSWAAIATDLIGTVYSDTAVTCNSPFDYRVIAHSAVSSSLPSAVASATTDFCTAKLVDTNIGGFEGDFSTLGWERQNTTKDKQRCNNPDLEIVVAHSGECAFRYKGSPTESSRLRLVLQVGELPVNPDDQLILSAWVDVRKDTTLFKALVKVVYQDKTRDSSSFVVRDQTQGYAQFIAPLEVTKPIQKVIVILWNRSRSGTVYVDTVDLSLVSTGAYGLIALPGEPATDLRDFR